MKAFILTYHSHHVVGSEYHVNDHVALARDLDGITRNGFEIVPLSTLVDALGEEQRGHRSGGTGRPMVVLTFDDGPVFDVQGFVHPEFGRQPGFLQIMREFQQRNSGGGGCTSRDLTRPASSSRRRTRGAASRRHSTPNTPTSNRAR